VAHGQARPAWLRALRSHAMSANQVDQERPPPRRTRCRGDSRVATRLTPKIQNRKRARLEEAHRCACSRVRCKLPGNRANFLQRIVKVRSRSACYMGSASEASDTPSNRAVDK